MTESQTNSSLIEVNGYPIWFEIFGTGPIPVLLIPGGIGTGRTDFYEQLEGEECLDLDKFTIVAVEAPGSGRSRPPARKYNSNLYENDSQCFHRVMQHLGYDKYSIIGWSDGAKAALLMATKYRESIESLVLTAISTYVSEDSKKFFLTIKNVNTWSTDKIEAYLRSYESKEEIQILWTKFSNYVNHYEQYFPEDICKNKYHLVNCPVLIFHGDRDQMIDVQQPLNVCKNLKNAKIYRISGAAHDLHQRYPLVFKKLTEEHLLSR